MGQLISNALACIDDPDTRITRFAKGWSDVQWDQTTKAGSQLTARARRVVSKGLSAQEQWELVTVVRKCVESIASNLAKAQRRIFNRNGDEVLGGDLFNLINRPSPSMDGQDFIREITSWWNIENEIAVIVYPGGKNGAPINRLKVVNPMQLQIVNPANWMSIHDLSEVNTWQYLWPNATEQIGARYMMFHKGFNPYSMVRGMAPGVTANNEASSQYQITRYNKTFFENNAQPSHILKLTSRANKDQRDAFEQKYLEQFGTYGDNAHKVMVVSGDKDSDVEVVPIDTPQKDGGFMELAMSNKSDIAGLYGVPPIVIGIHDQTRYETAEVQFQSYYDNTLCPQAETISKLIQIQLVDAFFQYDRSGALGSPKKKGFSKQLEKSYEDTLSREPDSELIFLLDTDTMPVMSSIKSRAVEMAGNLVEKLKVPPKEAGDWVGLSFDPANDEVRSQVYIKSTELPITSEKFMARLPANKPVENNPNPDKPRASEEKPRGTPVGSESRAKKELTDEEKEVAKKIERLIHGPVRKAFLESLEVDKTPALSEIDALCADHAFLRRELRIDCYNLRGAVTPGDIKDYLNDKYDRAFIRELVSE